MSITPEIIQTKLDRLLPRVEKPGRYIGGELNQVVKNWQEIETKICLAFPDLYDLGMSNYGLAILYDLINQRTDLLAERTFSPWSDMEAIMREERIPLYALESKRSLDQFDIIGISLPYETLFTNTLNLLDLAEIPLRSSDRNKDHPLVIAGGHGMLNPEPMHAFIDAIVIGEGEQVIFKIIDVYQEWKRNGKRKKSLLENS